jgi:hypothetical protein
VPLLFGLENTAEKISQLQFRQSKTQSKTEAFKKLINNATSEFDFICQDPPKTAIDGYVKLIAQEIYEAERTGAVYTEDAEVCRNLVRVLRMTYGATPIKSEPSA